MSQIGMLIPLAAITVGPIAWGFNNWLRVRHGYPLVDRDGEVGEHDAEAARRLRLTADENAALRGTVARLEERIAVLERIATDPAARTLREIDALTHR